MSAKREEVFVRLSKYHDHYGYVVSCAIWPEQVHAIVKCSEAIPDLLLVMLYCPYHSKKVKNPE